MKMKHTPGPWRKDGTSALGAYGVWTDYGTHAGAIKGQLYADQVCSVLTVSFKVTDKGEKAERRNANAQLIASAPELLDALREVEAHHVSQNRLKGRDEQRSTTLRIVRAAIQKATTPN